MAFLLSNTQTTLKISGVIEIVAGFMIAFGFLTVWAAFLASGTMAVAYTQFHWKLAFGSGFFPAVNEGDPSDCMR